MKSKTRQSDETLAVPMFCTTVLFLSFLALALHLTAQSFLTTESQFQVPQGIELLLGLMVLLLPVFWAEAVWHFWIRSPRRWWTLVACIVPPLRLARRDLQSGTRIWLPILGWRHIDEDLHHEVERTLSGPMIVVALMILPLLMVDFLWSERLAHAPWLQGVVATGYSITWLAFTMEFLLMISIVKKKFLYLKQHWVDLLIICLPLIAFLRVLRMSQLLRLQQVTKASRVYRMRGLALRVWRGLLAMDVVSRLMRVSPDERISTLQDLVAEKQREIERLQAEIRHWEAKRESTAPGSEPAALREGEAA